MTYNLLNSHTIIQDYLFKNASLIEDSEEFFYSNQIFQIMLKTALKCNDTLRQFLLTESLDIQEKADKSLVTKADIMLDNLIQNDLKILSLPYIGEESIHDNQIINSGTYLISDPIDGTNNFIRSLKYTDILDGFEHCTLIAYVENGLPIIGISINHFNGDLDVAIYKNNIKFQSNINLNNVSSSFIFKGISLHKRLIDLNSNNIFIYGKSDQDDFTKNLLNLTTSIKIGSMSARLIAICHPNIINGLIAHRAEHHQNSGLWDVAVATVFARLNNVSIYTGNKQKISFTENAYIQSSGILALKGNALNYTLEKL